MTGAICALLVTEARAQEQLFFPSHQNTLDLIVSKINAETVRVDIATWYLTDRRITSALVARKNAGVTVRVIGDRASIFEIDDFTRREFEYLATNGVPIRLRYHPTDFPEIMHWKAGIFVGQGVVEFGSANWTSFELGPASSSNFKDETVMFTDDPVLVSAFKSRFDQFWADTSDFLDWPSAYERETGTDWTLPMSVDRTRLEPTVSGPSTMIWEQGSVLTSRMSSEIRAESKGIDLVVYRLSAQNITDALLDRIKAGVPVRVMLEPFQYREDDWPEYWLTGAQIDRLWMAGARIRERVHQGLTHMKVLITSRTAMHGSSNFTNNWQRDHNYFIPASTKPALYNALRGEFDRIWVDTVHYRDFYPDPPASPLLVAPALNATGLATRPRLEWKQAPWAVAFDIYLGTSESAMTFQGRVNAVLTESPPSTYSWTPPSALQSGTRYFWQVVARTFATDVDPSLVGGSATFSFVTNGTSGGGSGSLPGPGRRSGLLDFDGDGVSDPVVYRPSSGTWWILNSTTQFQTATTRAWGLATDLPVPEDYDGDGRTDLAVYRPSTGTWWVLLSGSNYAHSSTWQWGVGTDIPVPGDYDGDGRADVAVFRPANGTWYILWSGTGFQTSSTFHWGIATDLPVPADYDGDARTDLAVYRPSGGTWYVLESRSSFQSSVSHRWGIATDDPVPSDYDGDSRADVAVFRPANGTWYVLQSSSGSESPLIRQWGVGTDIPVPGDFDGNGRSDLTVFRPSGAAVWFVWNQFSIAWGTTGDVPLFAR